MLELKNIVKKYNNHIIFNNMNFDFSHTGIYFISGESGSGKSTLLNIILGYEDFDLGQRIIPDNIKTASIFQTYELINELTVLENINLHCDVYDKQIDESLIRILGLEDLLDHYPDELSYGQKQRVGILRAIYQNPDLIICDEPVESLDIDNKEIVLNLLKELSKTKVVIVACHDIEFMNDYYDYHYIVADQQLKCIDNRGNNSILTLNNDVYSLNKAKIRTYINKIIKRRTIIINIIFILLVMSQSLLFLTDINLFEVSKQYNALDYSSIYVKVYNDDLSIINKYKTKDITYKPILLFNHALYNDKVYKFHFAPSLEINNNEIIINQYVLEQLNTDKEAIIGKTITLSYNLINTKRNIDFIVKDVIEEDIYPNTNIYYSYDYVCYYLKNQPGSELYLNEYEYFINESKYYCFNSDNNIIIDLYNRMSKDSSLSVTHYGIEGYYRNTENSMMFKFLFRFIEILLFVITLMIIFYYNNKDSFKNNISLSIIQSMNIDIDILKKYYLKEKLRLSFYLILLILISIIDLRLIIYVLLLLLFQSVLVFINTNKLKVTDVLYTLKEAKDI